MPRSDETPALFSALPVPQAPLPLHGLTILAVEDSRFTSDALRLMCQRSGARLRRAESLAAAASHLRLYRPDVAIVDLGLPDGRGEDLIRSLSLAGGPVVFGTSGDPGGGRAALAAGAAGFLEKPLPDLQGFQAAILAHLSDRHLRARPFRAGICPDPLALRDDLRRAEAALARPGGPARDWLRGFLSGLALQAHDPALAAVSEAVDRGQADSGTIGALLRERIDRTEAFRTAG